ncbi:MULTISPECIES: zinc-binding dehydrogenase [unclassified Streptomyces]|uniref:zinc-binding dehydrogenase n=1 Tax=unclassified Streptomyces TaxID=2593676 RepID=UPI00202F1214|nr:MULTISPECIES: zinc-binding dehydrogenase [unclassified Streptomyces]MCM1973466.1 zinc-binding dehydrogenase [Streptomyces sp. G1]MCX5129204.1 zinc-binding dehydrogenase [Streptomyces sp. NBC_00347]
MTTNNTPLVQALVQQSLKGPKDLILTFDHPLPVAGPGAYLVRVGAAGVNFADVMQSHGTYDGGPAAPYTAGFEAAGEIVAVGPGVENPLPVGTHVVGTGYGAFAQYTTLPAAGALPVPDGWSDAQSLGLVLNWATALAALKPLGDIERGETVLVHAAAGGVGQAAVRLARHYGARVIATASPSKHETVLALGADHVLDSGRPDLAKHVLALAPEGVDIALESVGRATFRDTLAVTRPVTGSIVVLGAASGHTEISTHDLIFTHRVQIKGLHIGAMATEAPQVYAGLLTELRSLIADGVYPPGTPEVHALADGPRVLRQLESRRTTGKLALDPWA